MYRIERFLKIYEMGLQNFISFVDLFQYIPESKYLVSGTSVLSKASLFLPQDVVDTLLDPTYQQSSKDLAKSDW